MSNLVRTSISQPRTRLLIIAATTALGALWLSLRDPTPVVRVMTPLPEQVPFWYMLSAFPIFGMLLADLSVLFAKKGLDVRVLELAFQLGILVLISSLRLTLKLPISGHTLLFTFFLFRRWWFRKSMHGLFGIELLAGFLLFLITAYIKLITWGDPISWIAGVISGVVLVLIPSYAVQYYEETRTVA